MIRTKAEARNIRAMMEAGANTLPEEDAARGSNRKYHPKWNAGIAYETGNRVQYNDRLYKCLQPHTAQEGWEPENVPALWQGIDEIHDGTRRDPIPYAGNMALEKGKYYTQNGKLYRCTRDTGIAIYNDLADLVKLYVEEVGSAGGEGSRADGKPSRSGGV